MVRVAKYKNTDFQIKGSIEIEMNNIYRISTFSLDLKNKKVNTGNPYDDPFSRYTTIRSRDIGQCVKRSQVLLTFHIFEGKILKMIQF